jgi:GNAT superfamily N-acetyltransferase
MVEFTVTPIAAAATRPLRRSVLRPHQRESELVFSGDDAPTSFHAGAFVAGELEGVASIVAETLAGHEGERCWRVRGMATLPRSRGAGLGGALLEACLDHARKQGGTLVWCHARTPAVGFYRRYGFETHGEEFVLPSIGPHFLMERRL